MKDFNVQEARQWILSRLEKQPFRAIEAQLPRMIEDFILYDLHFMRITGVLDENDCEGDSEYDEDEAFEFIYDAYLSDHPTEDDEDMIAASLLNRYMELQTDYLTECGLLRD